MQTLEFNHEVAEQTLSECLNILKDLNLPHQAIGVTMTDFSYSFESQPIFFVCGKRTFTLFLIMYERENEEASGVIHIFSKNSKKTPLFYKFVFQCEDELKEKFSAVIKELQIKCCFQGDSYLHYTTCITNDVRKCNKGVDTNKLIGLLKMKTNTTTEEDLEVALSDLLYNPYTSSPKTLSFQSHSGRSDDFILNLDEISIDKE